jgi:hypothetical protein
MTVDPDDPRARAFRSPALAGLFHAFAYSSDVWKPDPFDVESIHADVRRWFDRTVDRVLDPAGPAAGRMLLLLGESGSGKTHLMRAFRGRVHGAGRGYCAYMQMTAFNGAYGRYALNNIVESLDRPYFEPRSTGSALARIASKLADSLDADGRDALDRLREGGLDQSALDAAVAAAADELVRDPKFAEVDVYLLQALLYLQSGDPAVKARVLKYLRCEDLNDHDRRVLGGIVPCTYADAPHWMIERIGKLIWAVERVPLVVCVDQLEDVFDLDEAALKFRKAMAVLCDVVSRLPSAVVVVSCLENFYDELKSLLTRSTRDRVENDPRPVSLQTPCDLDEVKALIGRRLRHLFESAGAASAFRDDDPTYPIPEALVSRLVGLRARDVLIECQAYRDRCIEEGKMAPYPLEGAGAGPDVIDAERSVNAIERDWNAFRSDFEPTPGADEKALAAVLAEAVADAAPELAPPRAIACELDGRFVTVELDGVRRLVSVCDKSPKGGALARQIGKLTTRAEGQGAVAVALRSTAFPANPKTDVFRLLEAFDQNGGRRSTVEDSDWRTMAAFARFRQGREADPAFDSWRKRTRPLTNLEVLRTILDLDRPAPEV